MDDELKRYLKDGDYLPSVLKDFHDQKDIFKAMHLFYNIENNKYLSEVSWATGHVYAIDMFLHFMARAGWTLQRSRSKQNFESLDERIEAVNGHELRTLAAIFANNRKLREAETAASDAVSETIHKAE